MKKLLKVLAWLVFILVILFLIVYFLAPKILEKTFKKAENYPHIEAHDKMISGTPPLVDVSKYKLLHFVDSNNEPVAIAIAVSGGGYRASFYTMGVLSGLENMNNGVAGYNLLNKVKYISSVSGGGFAIGYYLSKYSDYLHNNIKSGLSKKKPFSFGSVVESDIFTSDGLNANLQKEFGNLSKKGKFKYQLVLKDTFLRRSGGLPSLSVGDIFISKTSSRKAELPIWIANSSIFQNFAIFPFTPNILKRYKIDGYFVGDQYIELDNVNNLPMSFAVAASSSTPVIFPSMTLTSSSACAQECYLQLFDGAWTDNLGVINALSALMKDKAKTKVLILIDAFNQKNYAYSKNKKSPNFLSVAANGSEATSNFWHTQVSQFMSGPFKTYLCSNSKNVFLSAMRLNDNKKYVSKIGTNLHLDSIKRQKFLLSLGENDAKNNKELKDLVQFLVGKNKKLGLCSKK